MKINFLKLIPMAMLPLATSAFAAMDTDSRVSQLEKQMKEVRVKNAMGTYGATTAPARVQIENGQGWFIMLGPIYEHARVGGTEFTYTDDDPVGMLPIRGRTKDIDFDWDWGIRAAIGYNFDHDDWDTQLEYTWFSSSGSRSVTAGLNSSDIPLKGSSTIVSGCANFFSVFGYSTIAKSQFDFDYNTVVLELGRNYFVSKMLSLRPHFGLRSAWIDLEQVTRYSGGSTLVVLNSNGSGLGVHTVDVKDNSDMWGLGPRAGVNTDWFLGCGFSIFGNASGSLLYGYFDVDHREKFSLCQDTNRIKLDANQHRIVPVAQLQLGLEYEQHFCEDNHHIRFRLGYDAIYYWRANQTLKIDDFAVLKYERYTEDVAIHGVMLDAKWSF